MFRMNIMLPETKVLFLGKGDSSWAVVPNLGSVSYTHLTLPTKA